MVGRSISSYQILETLGEGGMGVVYRARDTRLERFVALKFLKPEGITADRIRRFLQEAKSVSALNHPNIVHIYDIGQFEGSEYIVMEYVEGVTLQALLAAERLTVKQALNFAVQIADAMAAAHNTGIVHRDLKPGNILIANRRRVKVVDFGLAKLVDPDSGQDGSDISDVTQTAISKPVYTAIGILLGTLAYMSPEQAEGRPVDARSDIFSFGLIMYEMLTGRPAFSGSKFTVLAAIVNNEPRKLVESCPEVSPELDWIVARCMRKDPERRFQRMSEVRAALEDLQAESGSSSAVKPISSTSVAALHPEASSTEIPPAARSKYRWLVWLNAALSICLAGAVFWLVRSNKRDQRNLPDLVRLTTESGLNIDPVISPDGKLLAYASDRAGHGDLDIWLRQIGSSNAVQLTHDPANDDEPTFSPDGTQIAFHSSRDGGGLYLVSTLGGPNRKLAEGGRNPRFSPDGSKIAYWTGPSYPFPLRNMRPQLFVVELSTLSPRRIRPDFVAALTPVWSPDGKHLLFRGLQKLDLDDSTNDWWITPLDDGPAIDFGHMVTQVSAPRFREWRGGTVYFIDDSVLPEHVSEIGVDPVTFQPVGTPKRLTSSTAAEDSPSISNDGRLVFTSLVQNTNLYALPFQSATAQTKGDPVQLTHDEGEDVAGSLTADGRMLAFSSRRTGVEEIWTREMSTGQEHEVTFGGMRPRMNPLISPDGKFVAWREHDVEKPTIFLTPSDGGSSRQTCADCSSQEAWTPDSAYLLYRQGGQPAHAIGLFDVRSGEHSVYLSSAGAALRADSITQDGKWILLTMTDANSNYTVYAAPFSPLHPPERNSWVELLRVSDSNPAPAWSRDAAMIVFSSSRDGFDCIWGLRVDRATRRPQGSPFPIRHFHSPSMELPNLAEVAQENTVLGSSQMVLNLRESSSSVWMIKMP